MNRKPSVKYYKDEQLLVDIGVKIRAHREGQKKSQESFANDIGVDYSQINRMELGKVNFSISNLYRIAKALGVDPKKLLP